MDALVFTAGIGENSPEVRAAVAHKLAFLGIKLDQRLNESAPLNQEISMATSLPKVLVVRSEEDWEIARQCYDAAAVTSC